MAWVILLICGIASAFIASSKGRNPIGWFFVGFLLGIIGLIICLVQSNLRERERERAQATADRRRLREKLRQEEMKNESFRRHAEARLDSHDQTLGTNTRNVAALPPNHGVRPRALEAGSAAPPAREWLYDLRGENRGPVSTDAILRGIEQGKISGETLVWKEGMSDWRAASEVDAFRSAFRS